MDTTLHLTEVRQAAEQHDPDFLARLVQLISQREPVLDPPPREGALTYADFQHTLNARSFRKKTDEEQKQYRVETFKALEADNAEVPLPDRLRVGTVLEALWRENSAWARTTLLQAITTVPLVYGPWRALKRIFKEAEAQQDTEVYGALLARFDAALGQGAGLEVKKSTLGYLARRGWRYLRRLAVVLPSAYADTASEVLCCYDDNTSWAQTWVANHLFFHEAKSYTRYNFRWPRQRVPKDLLKQRAYAELWQRTPRPLFSLLERAKAELVREFATTALKTDFRAQLREVEPSWVVRLVAVRSKTIDEFVVWLLNNVPRFEQASFKTLGLHETVLRLFDSPSSEAAGYAVQYARTHARNLPVAELLRLANNPHEVVRKLATDFLLALDPRKAVGLAAWGQLLQSQFGHKLAADVLRQHFGASELTPDWFQEHFFTHSEPAFAFLTKLFTELYPPTKIGAGYFERLHGQLDDPVNDPSHARVLGWLVEQVLPRFDPTTLSVSYLHDLLRLTTNSIELVTGWVESGKLPAQQLGLDFLKSLAYEPDWNKSPEFAELKQRPAQWAKTNIFFPQLAQRVRTWFSEQRFFPAKELGLSWLLELVGRPEPDCREFASHLLIAGFVPADFAPSAHTSAPATSTAEPVDLSGQTFVFTGKLASMTRDEAEAKVKQANGTPLSAVSTKLHYLVIGDEGSPLFGQGDKGSKQLKAEQLNSGGANIQIVSESAFLQILVGQRTIADADTVTAGCQRLWEWATGPGKEEAAVGVFARNYLRQHHPDLCLEKTSRPVDPGADIPGTFLSYARVEPLFFETRPALRELALDFARWEFARWQPAVPALIRLAEAPHPSVRNFVGQALLADDAPEHRRYRINPALLSPASVYSFCESTEEATRDLGMQLIQRSPRLQLPEELFRLSESPDRKVRAFIIRALSGFYRERGVTAPWQPWVPARSTIGVTAAKKAATALEQRGPGLAKRPTQLPAGHAELSAFLRRILFELPPGRPERSQAEQEAEIKHRLKPLPARQAKLGLVAVLRDVASQHEELAKLVLPLLEEFMISRGQSEQEACLVAVTRLRKHWGA